MTEQMEFRLFDDEVFGYHHGNSEVSRYRVLTREKKARDRDKILRPFIAWDGEGWNDEKGRHKYVLLANSLGEYILAEPGFSLSRREVFGFMVRTAQENPTAIHVVYGGNYDFNMILKGNGLSQKMAASLYTTHSAFIDGYSVNYTPKRMLTVRETQLTWEDGKHTDAALTMYDVLPFFQTSFVKACDSYLGIDWFERDTIIRQKSQRANFSWEQLDEIIYYNNAELVNLVELMNELRERLFNAGLLVGKWYGPGAIAELMFKRNRVKKAMDQNYHETKPELAAASRSAYAGGRFELVRPGHSNDPVYEYDINSAYPYAMTKLPNLQRGSWRHVSGDPGDVHFAVYHIEYRNPVAPDTEHVLPQPFYARLWNGSILYPAQVRGWFWSPEIRVGREYVAKHGGTLTITEAFVFDEEDPNDRPMSFIKEYYRQRQVLKKRGNGAQVGIKLGLNSLYGKMAQQIGYDPGTKRLPPYHQLEWAGWVTSHCRAQLLSAVMDNLRDVIAFETDAVFTSVPLSHLSISPDLGDWELSEFSNMTYLQSGLRFGDLISGKEEPRTRGLAHIGLSRQEIVNGLYNGVWKISIPERKFITLGLALYQQWHNWCQWVDTKKDIELLEFNMGSKRVHLNPVQCQGCSNTFEMGYAPVIKESAWHETWIPHLEMVENREHAIKWVNPDKRIEIQSNLTDYDAHEVLF